MLHLQKDIFFNHVSSSKQGQIMFEVASQLSYPTAFTKQTRVFHAVGLELDSSTSSRNLLQYFQFKIELKTLCNPIDFIMKRLLGNIFFSTRVGLLCLTTPVFTPKILLLECFRPPSLSTAVFTCCSLQCACSTAAVEIGSCKLALHPEYNHLSKPVCLHN